MTERYCQNPGCNKLLSRKQKTYCGTACQKVHRRAQRIIWLCACGREKCKFSAHCRLCAAEIGGHWPEGARQRVLELANEGVLSARQIAERVGVSKGQVSGLCYRHAVSLSKDVYDGPSSMQRLAAIQAQWDRVDEETKPRPEHFTAERKQRTPEELAYAVRPYWRDYAQ